MGRNALLTVAEVAEILEVTPHHVRDLTRKGVLRAYHPEGRPLSAPPMYRPEQVDAYLIARVSDERVDLATAYNKALKVEVLFCALERRIAQLELLAGVDVPRLPYNEAAVKSLVAQVEEAIGNPPTEADDILRWSRTFLGLHEEFFELVERYTGHPKPWEPFARLARAIRESAPTGKVNRLPLEQAYQYFNAAYIVLRQSMILHVTDRHGKRAAAREFPEESGLLLERVLRHLPR